MFLVSVGSPCGRARREQGASGAAALKTASGLGSRPMPRDSFGNPPPGGCASSASGALRRLRGTKPASEGPLSCSSRGVSAAPLAEARSERPLLGGGEVLAAACSFEERSRCERGRIRRGSAGPSSPRGLRFVVLANLGCGVAGAGSARHPQEGSVVTLVDETHHVPSGCRAVSVRDGRRGPFTPAARGRRRGRFLFFGDAAPTHGGELREVPQLGWRLPGTL